MITNERQIEEYQDEQIEYQERVESQEEFEQREETLEDKLRMELQEDIYWE